jgi:hypothetical protein
LLFLAIMKSETRWETTVTSKKAREQCDEQGYPAASST